MFAIPQELGIGIQEKRPPHDAIRNSILMARWLSGWLSGDHFDRMDPKQLKTLTTTPTTA